MTSTPAGRRLAALGAALAGLAVQAATAIAAAGGGSGGFGGGGGGGGGGGVGGGSGSGSGSGDGSLGGLLVVFGGVAAVLVFGVVQERRKATWSRAYANARDKATARRRRARAQEVEGTAVIAQADDAAFAAEKVRTEAEALFRAVQEAWDRDDRDALAAMVAPDLMAEWRLRLEDFAAKGWRNHVAVRSCTIEYVGITNRAEDSDDRAVVRVSALLDDYVTTGDGERIHHDGNTSGETHLREYWTLGKREDDRWTLLSIEQDEEGAHQLDAPLEADPAEDARLRDRVRVEAAVADALPAGVRPSEVDDDDARSVVAKARDLAVADPRFDPDIIEAAVRRAVAAWAEAVDGDDSAFAHLARPALLEELLYPPSPGRSLRLVVRAPVVTSVVLSALDTDVEPATATVRMGLEGVRYVEDRNTLDTVAGSTTGVSRFDGTWTLALDGPPDAPWRVSAVRDDPPPAGA